jgi:hypothetical protein
MKKKSLLPEFLMRNPRTTQEKRENGKRNRWGRPKRSARNLPDAWDDIHTRIPKTWKRKRKRQYRNESRGKENIINIEKKDNQLYSWNRFFTSLNNLEDHFKKNDIPYIIISKRCHYEIKWWSNKSINVSLFFGDCINIL